MAQDFLKLEKIEYGGVKGTMLSEVTLAMFGEFNDLFKVFTDSSYDLLDLTDDVSVAYDVTKIRHYILNDYHFFCSRFREITRTSRRRSLIWTSGWRHLYCKDATIAQNFSPSSEFVVHQLYFLNSH